MYKETEEECFVEDKGFITFTYLNPETLLFEDIKVFTEKS